MAKYKLTRDSRGNVICLDEKGRRVSIGRCFAIGVQDDGSDVEIKVRKSCALDEENQKEVISRLQAKDRTVWALTKDEDEDWEETDTDSEWEDRTEGVVERFRRLPRAKRKR